jgi:FHA domain-containing protein/von Willebrand factor type A domain-containing protein
MNRRNSDNFGSTPLPWHLVIRRALVSLLFIVTSNSGLIAQTLDVLVALDQSRSMKQNDPKRMVPQAVADLIQQLPVENAAGLVLFGSQAWPVQSLGPLGEEHRRQLVTSIADIRYSDAQSNPVAALEAALDEFRNRGRRGALPLILLLTDGGIDTGSNTRDAEILQVLETQVLTEIRRQKIRIYSIAFTTGADLSLLEKIARESGGECYLALTEDALESAFGRLRATVDKLLKPVSAGSQAATETSKPSQAIEQPVTPPPVAPRAASGFPYRWFILGLASLMGLAAGCYLVFFLKPKPTREVPVGPLEIEADEPLTEATLVDLRTGQTFRIQKKTIQVGRKPDNDLVIAERTVSGHHARIRYEKGRFYVEDLQSANETKVNGLKVVGEVELHSGDVVRFDQFGYTFKLDVTAERTLLR